MLQWNLSVYFSDPDALKQLIALYVGRCFACWKLPEVMAWLEKNVKLVIQKVENKDPRVEEYATKYEFILFSTIS